MPKIVSDKDVRFFLHGEWKIFREGFRPSMLLMLDTALVTGARWGEYSALRRMDCHITEDEDGKPKVDILIGRAWKERGESDTDPILEDEFENKTWKLGPPKNGRKRWVSVTDELAERFIAEIEDLAPEDYVFITTQGNPWRYPDFHTDHWVPAVMKAEKRGVTKHLTTHMLRHTCVVWALAKGERIERISEWLGHSSIQMTYDKYGGIINLRDASVAKSMAIQLLVADEAIVPAADLENEKIVTPRRVAARARLARKKQEKKAS
jgi:integrase